MPRSFYYVTCGNPIQIGLLSLSQFPSPNRGLDLWWRQRVKGWRLVLWVRRFGLPFTFKVQTDRMFNKKSKKLHKSSQRHVSLGIPTNIAVGPLGFRAELDIGPQGERVHDFGGDRSDSTAMLDENDVRASRIAFNDGESEGQGLPVPGSSTSGAAVGGDDHGTNPISECFRSLLLVAPDVHADICQEKIPAKLDRKKTNQWRRLGVRANPVCLSLSADMYQSQRETARELRLELSPFSLMSRRSPSMGLVLSKPSLGQSSPSTLTTRFAYDTLLKIRL